MVLTTPTRVDADLYQAAQVLGPSAGRSVAQQITYWCRIGRAFDATPTIDSRAATRALAGSGDYDKLTAQAQAAERARWEVEVPARVAALDLERSFESAGAGWVDADAQGNPVLH